MSDLKKDKECIGCKHFFDCDGKPSDKPCINYEEEKSEYGRKWMDQIASEDN